MINAEYDPTVDSLYVWLVQPQDVADTVEVDSHRNVDLDAEGNAIGIEIVGMGAYAVDDIAERFGFKDTVAEINYKVGAAVADATVTPAPPKVVVGAGHSGPAPLESGSALKDAVELVG